MTNDNLKTLNAKMHNDAEKITICKDNLPTIFVDGFSGLSVTNGVVKLNLVEDSYDPAKENVTRSVVVRLAMSTTTFSEFVQVINSIHTEIFADKAASREIGLNKK